MYIFLDCDGVINQLQPNYYIDETCIKVLSEITKVLDGKVVLTSTWRLGYLHDFKSCTPQIQRLLEMFKKYNIPCIGRTKKVNDDRSVEIQLYLDEHDSDDYIILDDDSSLFTDKARLYRVNSRTGLVKGDVKHIRGVLCI